MTGTLSLASSNSRHNDSVSKPTIGIEPGAQRFHAGVGQLAAEDEGGGCVGGRGLISDDWTQPCFGFRRAYADDALVLHVDGCRLGGAASQQLAILVVAQGDGRVALLGGATAQDTFDDGVGHGHSFGRVGVGVIPEPNDGDSLLGGQKTWTPTFVCMTEPPIGPAL